MSQFGLIGEGITDQIVIENILIAYFSNPDLLVYPLQPLRDATNNTIATTSGNWHKVLEYCGSTVFYEAFQSLDYVVIQVDSDVFMSSDIPEKYRNRIFSSDNTETIIEKIKDIIIDSIGKDHYNQVQEKVIFAISVHAIECWLLPIYFPTQPGKAAKITGCLETLNRILPQREGFFIDDKKPKYYQKISRNFIKMKQNEFKNCTRLNESLSLFTSSLANCTL